MAKTPATLDSIAPLLELSTAELYDLLYREMNAIKNDPIEAGRYNTKDYDRC